MRKRIFFNLLFFFSIFVSFAQHRDSTIEVVKKFGGYQFYQGNKRVTMSQLVKIMEPYEQASKQIKAAQANNVLATVFGMAGGALVGWPLGTALGGGKPNWTMAGIGAGLFAFSIPFNIKVNRLSTSAVAIFNENKNISSFNPKTEMQLCFAGNKIGVVVRF